MAEKRGAHSLGFLEFVVLAAATMSTQAIAIDAMLPAFPTIVSALVIDGRPFASGGRGCWVGRTIPGPWCFGYYPAMAWIAKCPDCEQEVEITHPVHEVMIEFLRDVRENAIAYYQLHPRSAADPRSCTGSGKTVPKYYIRDAKSTTPEDLPDLSKRFRMR